MIRFLAALPLAVAAVACDRLPELPEMDGRQVPTTLRLVEVPESVVAGGWTRVSAQVFDQNDTLIPGQVVTVEVVVADDEVPGLLAGLGNTCSTGAAGEACSVRLQSVGPQGEYSLRVRSASIAPIGVAIEVVPAPERAILRLEATGRVTVYQRSGDKDELKLWEALPVPTRGVPVAVTLTLLDAFGNPVPAAIEAELLGAAEPPPRADAGPGTDAGRPDTAGGDAQPGEDVGSIAPAGDSGAPADGGDAGGGADVLQGSDGGPRAPAAEVLRLSLGADCNGAAGARATALPDAAGKLVLCLHGGARLGPARVALSVPGVLQVSADDGTLTEQLVLATETVPVGHLTLIVEGEPRLVCAAGGATNGLYLRVMDTADPPSPMLGIVVLVDHVGLDSVHPVRAVTGPDGRLPEPVRGICPARRPESASITAHLPDDPTQTHRFAVEVQTGEVARLSAALHNAAPGEPWTMRVGDRRSLAIDLSDAGGNPVSGGAVSFSLPPARADSLRLAAPACGAATGDSLTGLTCRADGDGQIVLDVRAAGLATGVELPLQLRGHNAGGADPTLVLPLDLRVGDAAQLTLSPAGQWPAIVGLDGGTLAARVSDVGGNPVAGVAVTLSGHPSVVLSPLALQQTTGADGAVRWQLLQVSAAGQHALVFGARLGGAEVDATLVINTELGEAADLRLTDRVGDPVPLENGAWRLRGDAGSVLSQVHRLAVVNERGGVVAGVRGLSLTLLEQDPAGCDPLAALASAQLDEQGLLAFGGAHTALHFGTLARRCRYRLSVGNVEHDLLLDAHPGPPSGGVFEHNVGAEGEGAIWAAVPANGRLGARPGFAAHPGAQPLAQRHHLRLLHPADAYGNAIAVGTALQPAVANGWAQPEVPAVQADGALYFSVMAGDDYGADAVLTASSLRGWGNPPQLRFLAEPVTPSIGALRVAAVDRKVFPYGNYAAVHEGRVRANAVIGEREVGGNAVAIDRFADQDQLYRPADDCTSCRPENPADGLERYLAPADEAQAQIVELTFWGVEGAIFEGADATGRCAGPRCTRAVLHWLDDGRGELPAAQWVGRYALQKTTGIAPGGAGAVKFVARVPIADLSGGGIFGAALEVDVGDGEVLTSAGQSFFAPLRPWHRPRPLEVLAPPPPPDLLERYAAAGRLQANWRGFARILDVQRIQADGDAAEELLLCGDDAFGGWVALAQVDPERAARGANPFGDAGEVQAVRTFYSPGYLDEDLGEGGEPERWIPPEHRLATGFAARPSGCAFVPEGPGGAWVISLGRPGSTFNPGAGALIATPLRGGALGPSQAPLALTGVPGGFAAATELNWGNWEAGDATHSGPVVRFAGGVGDYGFAATVAGDGLGLASGAPAELEPPVYSAVASINLDGSRWPATCNTWSCFHPGQPPGLGEGTSLEIERSPGRLIGATDWGGGAGLLRFWRHTPRLAWSLPRRLDATCRAQDGRMLCTGAVCGDGVLSYAEACEPGAGCSDTCQLVGHEQPGDPPVAGLAIPFAPMSWQDDGPVRLPQAFSAAPITNKTADNSGALCGISCDGVSGLAWSHWYRGRAQCRRLGGDYPTERQWEGAASGGHGGAADGPRPNPWGATPAAQASVRGRGATRAGDAWLGVTPEGLADLTSHLTSYGEFVLADHFDRPLGEAPQSGPTGGEFGATFKGSGADRSNYGVRLRDAYDGAVYRFYGSYGVSRCVWPSSPP